MPKDYIDKENLELYHKYVGGAIKKLSDSIDDRVSAQFAHFIVDNVSDTEILDARNGERTLKARIDKVENDANSSNREVFNYAHEIENSVLDLATCKLDKNTISELINKQGYFKLPSGIYVQWGTLSIPIPVTDVYENTISFPIEFPHQCFVVNCSLQGDNTNHYLVAGYNLITSFYLRDAFHMYIRKSSSNFQNISTGTLTLNYVAIGY